jgi:hypothetical protein
MENKDDDDDDDGEDIFHICKDLWKVNKYDMI